MLPRVFKKYSNVGLGGEGILRTCGQPDKACEVIQAAVDCGITYFDSARVYSDSEVYFGITPQLLIRYALSQEITRAIVGCSTAEEVSTLADTGRDLKPLSTQEKTDLMQTFEPYAPQLAYYRGTL